MWAEVGVIAGVVGALAALAVVPEFRRFSARLLRSRRPGPQVLPPDPGERFDVFVAHAPKDAKIAGRIARDLRDMHGFEVFLPAWANLPGTVRELRRGEGILASVNGILVFSETAVRDTQLLEDYAAALRNVYLAGTERRRLLIPVRTDNVELPAFAEIREPVNLGSGRLYKTELARVVTALRQTA
ncbi:hypothetical protein Acor_57410 [Acrocarpospora corrugata]|uniref:TIR domain-containing protein n=1 Tax=Acrocarpospora corrugata TaxID=35763 RepID=A0A5M3W3R0_9ACTN|nr:toll/interleukin-1 receptor domain-containing protein [Acrocarpospora corrugata]GES03675.1 hypothetical protein Acor_57410 [Acrocarpospora corrugata]